MSSSNPVKIYGGKSVIQIADVSTKEVLTEFDISNISIRKAVLVEPINQWKTCNITFESLSPGYIDTFLNPFVQSFSQKNQYPIVSFRFGLSSGSEVIWRKWEDMVISRIHPTSRASENSGQLITMQLVDRLWLLNTISHVKVYKGQISQIVKNLWEIDAGGDESIIEQTQILSHSSATGIWYQAREKDWSFLIKCLLPIAQNSNGTSGYRLFVRDNALRFHSPSYAAASPLQLAYVSSSPGFPALSTEDNSMLLSGENGSLGTKLATFDPITGNSYLAQSDSSSLLTMASSRPSFPSTVYNQSHVGPNTYAVEQIKNQHLFSVYNSEMYQLTLSAKKCVDIRVGDVLNILMTPNQSTNSQYSGNWLANRIQTTMDEGDMSTLVFFTRGEFNSVIQKKVSATPSLMNEVSSVISGIKFVPASVPLIQPEVSNSTISINVQNT